MLHELTLPQAAVRSVVQRKDYFRPLHVDCSIEYELPSQVKPPVTDKIDPLLMIHPCYFRKIEAQKRSPFINNLPSAIRHKSSSTQRMATSSRSGQCNSNSQNYSQYIKCESQIKSENNYDYIKQEVQSNNNAGLSVKQEDVAYSGVKQEMKVGKSGINGIVIKREHANNQNVVKQEMLTNLTRLDNKYVNNKNAVNNVSNNDMAQLNNNYLLDNSKKGVAYNRTPMQTNINKNTNDYYQNYNNHLSQNVPMHFNNAKVQQIMQEDYQKQWMMDQQLLNKMIIPNHHQTSLNDNKHLQDVSFLNSWLAENHVTSSDMYFNKSAASSMSGGKYRTQSRSNRLHPYVPNINSATASAAVGLQLGGGGFPHFNQTVVQQIPCYNL